MEFYKSIISFLVIFTIYNLPLSESYKFLAGGKDGWVIHPSDAYDHWAGRNRFLVNDTIFFKYKKGEDSVLLVNKEDYGTCNTKNPIKKWDDGGTIFKFDRSGPFYFISGKEGHCPSGQKLSIVVLAVRYPPSPPTPPKSGPAPGASPPSGGSSSPPTASPPSGGSSSPPTASPPSGGSSSPPTASPPGTPSAPSPGGSAPPVSTPPAASPMPAAMTPSSPSPTGVPGPTAISPSSPPSSGPVAASPTPALTPSITPASSSPPAPSSTSPAGAPGGGGTTSGASPSSLPVNSTSPPPANGSGLVIPPPRLWALVVVLVSMLVLG